MPEIPIYGRQELEDLATQFLAEYNKLGTFPVPIAPMVERLGLEIYPVEKFSATLKDGAVAALNWFTVTDIIFQAMLESLAKTFNVTASRVEHRLKDYGVNRD